MARCSLTKPAHCCHFSTLWSRFSICLRQTPFLVGCTVDSRLFDKCSPTLRRQPDPFLHLIRQKHCSLAVVSLRFWFSKVQEMLSSVSFFTNLRSKIGQFVRWVICIFCPHYLVCIDVQMSWTSIQTSIQQLKLSSRLIGLGSSPVDWVLSRWFPDSQCKLEFYPDLNQLCEARLSWFKAYSCCTTQVELTSEICKGSPIKG